MREAMAIKLQKPMIKGEKIKKKPGASDSNGGSKTKAHKTKEKYVVD